MSDALAAEQRHQRARHRGDEPLLTASQGRRLSVADRERLPGLMTRAPKRKRSPLAGTMRFVLNSTVKTAAWAGMSEKAAYPHALSGDIFACAISQSQIVE
jgi:hypothetical protein